MATFNSYPTGDVYQSQPPIGDPAGLYDTRYEYILTNDGDSSRLVTVAYINRGVSFEAHNGVNPDMLITGITAKIVIKRGGGGTISSISAQASTDGGVITIGSVSSPDTAVTTDYQTLTLTNSDISWQTPSLATWSSLGIAWGWNKGGIITPDLYITQAYLIVTGTLIGGNTYPTDAITRVTGLRYHYERFIDGRPTVDNLEHYLGGLPNLSGLDFLGREQPQKSKRDLQQEALLRQPPYQHPYDYIDPGFYKGPDYPAYTDPGFYPMKPDETYDEWAERIHTPPPAGPQPMYDEFISEIEPGTGRRSKPRRRLGGL